MPRYHLLTRSHGVATVPGSAAVLGWCMKWMEEAVTPSRALQIHLIENLQAENVSDIKAIRKDDALDLSQQLGVCIWDRGFSADCRALPSH